MQVCKSKKKSIKNVSFCNLINQICKQSLIATIHHSKVIQWLWKWGITRLYLIHKQNCIGWLKRGKNFMFFMYVRFSLAYFMCLIPVNGMFISYHFSGSKPFRIFILCLSNVKWFQNSRPETSEKSFPLPLYHPVYLWNISHFCSFLCRAPPLASSSSGLYRSSSRICIQFAYSF